MAGAVIIIRQKEIVEAFRIAGAVSPETAVPLEQAGVIHRGIAFGSLRRHRCLIEIEPSRWYLDEARWHEFNTRRRRILLCVFALVVIGALVLIAVTI